MHAYRKIGKKMEENAAKAQKSVSLLKAYV